MLSIICIMFAGMGIGFLFRKIEWLQKTEKNHLLHHIRHVVYLGYISRFQSADYPEHRSVRLAGCHLSHFQFIRQYSGCLGCI